jgi:pimeloyl-ACP methyl ester carboxylesterase
MSVGLAYREYGSGEPVLILHGLFGSGTNWSSLAKRLAAGFRVFTLDLRNHGDSPHARSMAYRDLSADVAAFMHTQSIDAATIIGHSMGGKAAMMLALLAPQRVERLCIVDIAPVDYAHDYDAILGAMRSIDLDRIERRGQADAALAASVSDPALRSFLLQNLRQRDGRWHWRIALRHLVDQIDVITGWPSLAPDLVYRGPALFVGGEHSSHLGAEHEATIRARFPMARVTHIRGAGHWVHAESPEEFGKIIDDFLEGRG